MAPTDLAVALEQRGFESLWVAEHSHMPVNRRFTHPLGEAALTKEYFDVMDPFVTLSAAAAVTKQLKLGTAICLVIQRDTIQTAKLVASLDQVSKGRFLFGIGDGRSRHRLRDSQFEDARANRGDRSGPRIPPSITARSSISDRCRLGPNRCGSRTRR
jgi:alkanesulfonate monooxygenase SsuD/methylene tetrahydromethanopterin reductase-like flavin-dependent oxidoreductase (luciferase family)